MTIVKDGHTHTFTHCINILWRGKVLMSASCGMGLRRLSVIVNNDDSMQTMPHASEEKEFLPVSHHTHSEDS